MRGNGEFFPIIGINGLPPFDHGFDTPLSCYALFSSYYYLFVAYRSGDLDAIRIRQSSASTRLSILFNDEARLASKFSSKAFLASSLLFPLNTTSPSSLMKSFTLSGSSMTLFLFSSHPTAVVLFDEEARLAGQLLRSMSFLAAAETISDAPSMVTREHNVFFLSILTFYLFGLGLLGSVVQLFSSSVGLIFEWLGKRSNLISCFFLFHIYTFRIVKVGLHLLLAC